MNSFSTRSSWSKTLELSKLKAAEQVVKTIRLHKKANSIVEMPFHNPSCGDPGENAGSAAELILLRGALDKQRLIHRRIQNKIDYLQLEDYKLDEMAATAQKSLESLNSKLKMLKKHIEKTRNSQIDAIETQNSLYHIIGRIRTTLVFLRDQKRLNNEELHLQEFDLEVNLNKSMKVKDQLAITHRAYFDFNESIQDAFKFQNQKLKATETKVSTLKEASMKRIDHANEQKILTEQILINDKSSALEELRKKYFVHFMLNMITVRNFEKEKIKFKKYEDAHQRIKLATGIQDISQVVHSFFTKELKYAEFTENVELREKKLIECKGKIEKLQESIQLIDKLSEHSSEDILSEKNKSFRSAQKEVVQSLVKFRRLKNLKDKITGWTSRVLLKLKKAGGEPDIDMVKSLENSQKEENLHSAFSEVKRIVHNLAKTLIGNGEKNKQIIESLKKQKNSAIISSLAPKKQRARTSSSTVKPNQLFHKD